MRSRGGRNDWPLEPMLKACIARIVYQHPSVESFRRELQRNPSLMLACGFKLMACGNDRQRYRVPSKSAFSRFNRLMNRAERDCGALSDMFDSLVKRVSQLLPDFGTHQGFDGKALESHSTGNDIADKGRPSDADARWGKHVYHYTDQKGRPQKKVKRWFGYSVNGIFAQRGKDHYRRHGCRFPLSRRAARTKVQPPFSPRCDGSDIRHVKAECGIDCGCACRVPAHEPNNFAKREASSLFADAEGCNMR